MSQRDMAAAQQRKLLETEAFQIWDSKLHKILMSEYLILLGLAKLLNADAKSYKTTV